ncbi:MAG TPA: phosphate acyltransferase PlsX [Clostridia bacterium]|nr:phosphate acyltransferase PlsX [Clostridia bacterium]
MRIAVDAMGGDNAPEEIIKGTIEASSEFGIEIVLVGDEQRIVEALKRHRGNNTSNLDILHAPQVIGMEEKPAIAIRKKRNSSIVRAVDLVRDENADAVVSAGNTGASMATSILRLGRISGIDRPALAGLLPSKNGVALLLDVGANIDCKPKNLLQFAVMGQLYAQKILGLSNPRVGLLSIGEESCKGNELTLSALPMLQKSDFNFIGNVEGRHIFNGNADVIVCDGFVGNIVLKAGEGLAKEFIRLLHSEVKDNVLMSNLQGKMDYREHGGAPLLGVNGISIVCHGNSNARAIKSAIRIACEAVNKNIVGAIRDNIVRALPGEVS